MAEELCPVCGERKVWRRIESLDDTDTEYGCPNACEKQKKDENSPFV